MAAELVHEFREPERNIKNVEDMEKWTKSQAYAELLGFIQVLNEAVMGKLMTDDLPASEGISQLLQLIETLATWVEETPAIDQPQRFGNKSFTKWWERVRENVDVLLSTILPTTLSGASIELNVYFLQSFGNPTRIDYGTGHEFKFCAFLCCLMKLGVVTQADASSLALKVFSRYLDLCRKLQSTYRMEPAGSHGVWGLDDFQFLPFIWGSSQLKNHPQLKPVDFVDDAPLHTKENMFMAGVDHIKSVKSGPFAEHSNILWNIGSVQEWSKVNSGLIKMFKAEVLGKFPVIQHFPFGTILSIEPSTTTTSTTPSS